MLDSKEELEQKAADDSYVFLSSGSYIDQRTQDQMLSRFHMMKKKKNDEVNPK